MNKANEICKPIKTIVTKDLLILLRKILRVVSIRNILLRKIFGSKEPVRDSLNIFL